MRLSPTDELFKAEDGSAVIFFSKERENDFAFKDVLYSPDGVHFHEMRSGRGRRSSAYLQMHYTECLDETATHLLTRYENSVVMDGKELTKAPTPASIDRVPLPHIRVPHYLFVMPDDSIIYISGDKHYHSKGTLRFFIGSWDALTEQMILDQDIYLDGGSSRYLTAEGDLRKRADYYRKPSTWTTMDGVTVELRQLQEDQVVATETEDGITMENPLAIPEMKVED